MASPVIISAVRTPSGRLLGSLASLSATRLGAIVVGAAVERSGLGPDEVDEVIVGQVVQAGSGQNPARQATLGAGLPATVPAFTVNKVCGSSLKAVMLAAQAVITGDASRVVAGGQESMSNGPYLLDQARYGYRLGHSRLLDATVHDGLWCAFGDYHIGCTGEIIAKRYGVSRQQQDEWALRSHELAEAARVAGEFQDEIVPVEVPQRHDKPLLFDADETIRVETSLETLGKLSPVFQEGGSVTAGNAPGVNDGASAVVVIAEEEARERNLPVLARIVAQASTGIEPELVMMAPVAAVRKVLGRAHWRSEDVDLYELNEAFAVQSVALVRELGLDAERVNIRGGAIALGHPIGASGGRILTTLLHAMRDRRARRGIAAMCLGGGNAVAMAVELP